MENKWASLPDLCKPRDYIVKVLSGHTGGVLSVDSRGSLIVSGSGIMKLNQLNDNTHR